MYYDANLILLNDNT